MQTRLNNFNQNPVAFMRSCGYSFDRQAGDEQSFMRRVSGYDYPRFHAYVHLEEAINSNLKTKNVCINLHLDQKKPSYGTSHAHSGEYDGELVTAEAERIKMIYGQSN